MPMYVGAYAIYDKVIVGNMPPDFDFSRINHRILDLVNKAKYFVKPIKYSHQCEFRIIWQMPTDVEDLLIIEYPEAVQFCRQS